MTLNYKNMGKVWSEREERREKTRRGEIISSKLSCSSHCVDKKFRPLAWRATSKSSSFSVDKIIHLQRFSDPTIIVSYERRSFKEYTHDCTSKILTIRDMALSQSSDQLLSVCYHNRTSLVLNKCSLSSVHPCSVSTKWTLNQHLITPEVPIISRSQKSHKSSGAFYRRFHQSPVCKQWPSHGRSSLIPGQANRQAKNSGYQRAAKRSAGTRRACRVADKCGGTGERHN